MTSFLRGDTMDQHRRGGGLYAVTLEAPLHLGLVPEDAADPLGSPDWLQPELSQLPSNLITGECLPLFPALVEPLRYVSYSISVDQFRLACVSKSLEDLRVHSY